MARGLRAAAATSVVVMTMATGLGCAAPRDHAAELAAAKCATPAITRVGPTGDITHEVVTKLGAGRRRVTGIVVDPSGRLAASAGSSKSGTSSARCRAPVPDGIGCRDARLYGFDESATVSDTMRRPRSLSLASGSTTQTKSLWAPIGKDGGVEQPCPLTLAPIDRHNWRAALAVEVTPAQLGYVAGHQPVALLILAKAYVGAGDLEWEPLAVTSGPSVVAVVALAHALRHTEVLHLAVDAARQGQGVGSAAVELLVEHVADTRPETEELRLTVHPDNERAQLLYRNRGFLPNGVFRDGEPVWSRRIRSG
jgi:ribosomal protein S18 acetylase RimI-like enzyme